MKTISIRSDYITNIPILVSMSLAALWVWYAHAINQSMPLFLGIIAGALVEMDDRLLGRLRNLFFTVIHFALAASLVQLTYGYAWAFALLLIASAFGVTLAGAIDSRYRTIAFGTLLVMLYTVLTHIPGVAWYINPVMLVCGTVLYSMCTIGVHVLMPNRPVQDNLAAAFSQLAEYMCIKARFFDPDEVNSLSEQEMALAMSNTTVIAEFNRCRNALFYRLRNAYRHPRLLWLLQYYLVVQNIHERISSRHLDYLEVLPQLAHSDLIFRIQRLIILQAKACQDLSHALRINQPYNYDLKLTRAGQGLSQAFALYSQANATDIHLPYLKQIIENIFAISDQLQRLPQIQADVVLPVASDTTIAGQDIDHLKDILPTLKAHFTMQSGVMRHAVRLAIVTAISCLIVEVFQLKMGYWILLTAVLVCQPNYSTTKIRLKQRIAGTLLGVLVGSVLPYFVDTLAGLLLIVVAGTVLFFVFRMRHYSFSTFFITVQVLAGFAIIGMDTQTAMLSRFMDTVIGCVLAWGAVAYLWPDWHYLTLDRIATRALRQDASYLRQIAYQLVHGQRDDVVYRKARRYAHECATLLSNTVADMGSEPKKYGHRLANARLLLQLNYILLSSISALGAMRIQLHASVPQSLDHEFLVKFCSEAEKIATQMTQIDQPACFQTEWAQVGSQLVQYQQETDPTNTRQHVLWAQLKRIHDTLDDYMQVLHDDKLKTIA